MLDKEKHLAPYEKSWSLVNEYGFITWRYGTGLNLELLHIQVKPKYIRQGYGREFFQAMLKSIVDASEGLTIFGFCLSNNVSAIQFYLAMGFDLVAVPKLYRDCDAVLFHQSYTNLMERHFNESEHS